jgi:hypothetical protein
MNKNNRSKQFWIKKFKEFLREHGIAAQYYNNCRLCSDKWPFYEKSQTSVDKRLSEIYDEFGPWSFIQQGFKWDETIEGWSTWSDLDNLWVDNTFRLKLINL